MKAKPVLLRAAKLASVATISLAMVASTPVLADSIYNPGTHVQDDFQTLVYKPNSGSYWNVLHGGVVNGVEVGSRDVACAYGTCAKVMQSNGGNEQGDDQGSFLRETQFAHGNLGGIVISNVSDLPDDTVTYGGPRFEPGTGVWYPTYGHPVTMEVRVRFSSNMKPDGTGGASGTAGLDLFNNVGSLNSNDPYLLSDLESIGFQWVSADSAITGLYAATAHDGFPQLIPIRNINMQQWNTLKAVWAISADGETRTVSFYVNGQFIGSTSDTGLESGDVTDTGRLSFEMRIDNQQYTFTGINTIAAPQTNYMDIASVNITQQ